MIGSAGSLLTVTTPVMDVGTAADRTAGQVSRIAFSGAPAGTATAIATGIESHVAAAIGIEIVTGTGTATGVDEGTNPFLTPSRRIRIMTSRYLADVAELADAQVSEACDGDIVEVQVLSSAPTLFPPQ